MVDRQYQVVFTRDADEELDSLPTRIQKRITKKARALASSPRPRGCRKLRSAKSTYGSEDVFRIIVGDYRVVYEVRDDILLVLILRARHRKDVYK